MKNIFFVLLLAALSACHFGNEKVDMIVHNAVIHSMDIEGKTFDAMAIKEGVIVAIGPEREIMNQYDAPVIYDAGKKNIYPGLIDGHCHFLNYGITLQDANLIGCTSEKEMIERLVQYAPRRLSTWIFGRGWDQNDWTNSETDTISQIFPNNQVLDSLFPNDPVYLTRIDGHAALANSKALELAGINANTNVKGGYVEVKNGRCTGILVDNAMQLIENILPLRTPKEKELALLQAQEACFSYGLTTLDEAGLMHYDISLIDSLQKSGKLKMRIYAMLSDHPENYEIYLKKGIDTSNRFLNVRSFKFYADGALGSRGACLLTPYDDVFRQTGIKQYGLLLESPEELLRKAILLERAGFQMNTHAIGDSAVRVVFEVYKKVLGGINDKRWRMEHAQVVSEKDMLYFRELGVIPSVQPTHATSDMSWAWQRLGRNRVIRAYRYKELMEQNGLVALGTDFPVEDINPFATYYSSVFRKPIGSRTDSDTSYYKDQALSPMQAMYGMTIWNAVANFEDHYKGTLEAGKVADFIVLDRDILKCGEEQLRDIKCMMTVVNGEIVYRR